MTNQFVDANKMVLINPPPELIAKWASSMCGYYEAAQWAADQELEACCEVLARELICDGKHVATDLRSVRRPNPPSLKEQAFKAAQRFYAKGHEDCTDEEIKNDFDIIRRALEQLND